MSAREIRWTQLSAQAAAGVSHVTETRLGVVCARLTGSFDSRTLGQNTRFQSDPVSRVPEVNFDKKADVSCNQHNCMLLEFIHCPDILALVRVDEPRLNIGNTNKRKNKGQGTSVESKVSSGPDEP